MELIFYEGPKPNLKATYSKGALRLNKDLLNLLGIEKDESSVLIAKVKDDDATFFIAGSHKPGEGFPVSASHVYNTELVSDLFKFENEIDNLVFEVEKVPIIQNGHRLYKFIIH